VARPSAFAAQNGLLIAQVVCEVGPGMNGKRRKLSKLETKEKRITDGKVHLCLASRILFRHQYDLQANGDIAFAKTRGKPMVLGKLDSSKKRKGEPTFPRSTRQLSSFGYSALGLAIHSRALLEALSVAEVNPTFTSVIGRIKYAKRLGVSVHQAAALAIGRRSMGYSETCPDRGSIPDGKGDHLIVGSL